MEMNIFLLIIIGANVAMSFKGFNDKIFFRKNEFHIGSIRSGEQSRMISSGFIHVDIQHLAFNMITLYFFAPYIFLHLSNFSFLLIYFAGLLSGSLLTLFLHKNEYNYSAVGASGAVMGVIYSAILLDDRILIYGFIPGWIFGIAYLLYSIYGMKAKNDNIGHTAHFGGAIGGFVFTILKNPALFLEKTALVLVMLIPILLLFVLAKRGKI